MQLNYSAPFQHLAFPPRRLSCERAWHTPRITSLISSTSRPSSPAQPCSAGTQLHDSDAQPSDGPSVRLPLPSGTENPPAPRQEVTEGPDNQT